MKKLTLIFPYKDFDNSFARYLKEQDVKYDCYTFGDKRGYRFATKFNRIRIEIKAFVKLLFTFRLIANRTLFCSGCQIALMTYVKLFGMLMGDYQLYIHNFYLHGLSKSSAVKFILKTILDNKRLTIICQAPNEMKYYRLLSNTVNLVFVPYGYDYEPKKYIVQHELPDNFIFVGGFTNRDYELVAELAKQETKQNFVFVASHRNKMPDLTSNVTLFSDLSTDEFRGIMSMAEAVIIPLKEDVGSSGQMVTIAAMRNRKPIIYSDVQAVNYYFPENCGYPYEIGDLKSLKNAYDSLMGDKEKSLQIGENAYQQSLKYTSDACYEQLEHLLFND